MFEEVHEALQQVFDTAGFVLDCERVVETAAFCDPLPGDPRFEKIVTSLAPKR